MGTQDRRPSFVRTIDESVENTRLTLQRRLDTCKSIKERRKLGQFATPTALARDIVLFGIKNMDAPHSIKFFDPAFGTGAFYSALLESAENDDIVIA